MKRLFFKCAPALMLLAISVCLNGQQGHKINTQESKIIWIGKMPGGEHKGYVRLKEGELFAENNEITGGFFVMDMNTITNTDIEDEAGSNKLVNHLKSPDFFDVRKYPNAKFTITNISRINNRASLERKGTHRIEGDLTMKGITNKVNFVASINALNGKFTAITPLFTINRTDWGVNYQSKSIIAGLADQFIYDDITLSIEFTSE